MRAAILDAFVRSIVPPDIPESQTSRTSADRENPSAELVVSLMVIPGGRGESPIPRRPFL